MKQKHGSVAIILCQIIAANIFMLPDTASIAGVANGARLARFCSGMFSRVAAVQHTGDEQVGNAEGDEKP